MHSLDIAALIRKLIRFLRYASLTMIAVTAIVIAREVGAVRSALADVHPALGWLFLAGTAWLLYIGAVRPAIKYWAMPAAVAPPKVAASVDVAELRDVLARAKFLARLAENLARNPRIASSAHEALAARDDALRIAAEAARPGADLIGLRARVRTLESTRCEALLKPLDEEASRAIRGEALAVGVGTAVSMSGVLDAWIVLWRNMNLVVKLAAIYYGRPGLRGSLFVLRDVATAMFVATKMQGLIDGAVGVMGGLLGRAGGALAGPLADGAVNALVTLRVGYVAKARCRAFRAWTEESARDTAAACFREAAAQGKGVVADVFKAAGGGVVKAGSEIWRKATDLVGQLFPKAEPEI